MTPAIRRGERSKLTAKGGETVRIIKPFSNLMIFGFFFLGLAAAWTNQGPADIYRSAKSVIINTSLLSFEQKAAINHIIRRAEEAWTEFSGKGENFEDDLDFEDTPTEDKTINGAIEKDERFWKDLL